MLCHEQMAAFMFAVTGNFPLAELYHPLHHLMGAGHLALAATFWAVRVRMLAGLQNLLYSQPQPAQSSTPAHVSARNFVCNVYNGTVAGVSCAWIN